MGGATYGVSRRTLLQLLTLLIFTLSLTGCDWDKIAQNGLYPTKDVNKTKVPDAPSGYEDVYLDISVEYPDQAIATMGVHGWFKQINNDPSTPVIVFFHGNGMNLGSMVSSNLLFMLEDLNTHVAVVDYPGYGKSTGQPSELSMNAMADSTIDWLKNRVPDSPIYVWGHSLGAAVALGLASRRQQDLSGWALTSGWTSLEEVARIHYGSAWGNVSAAWKAINAFNQLLHAQALNLPGVIQHGDKDDIIPFNMGESVFQALGNHNSEFVELSGRGHNDVFDDPRTWESMGRLINP
ncbi:MAG: alpha/beta hydrolase [Bdellovibrionales bacterium]|nr:alpha/beta hydrolase [Bdellovibrionales bacterium]